MIQKIAKPKNSQVLKGTPLAYPAGVSERYYLQLEALIMRMTATTKRDLLGLFQEKHAQVFFAEDKSISASARILMNALRRYVDNLFAKYAPEIADKMASGADKASEVGLGFSLREMSQEFTFSTNFITPVMRDILQATITENVGLIKSIATQYLDQVQGAVMRSITTGNGLADLVPFLAAQEGVTLRRARLIANDQVRKAYSNLNRGRMEKLGVEQFEWLHSSGNQFPRKLHIEMSGNVYSFNDLPVIDEKTGERGIPGQLINCKCRIRPVIVFSET